MTRKETTAIALKCFALYLLAQVIISLPICAGLGMKLGYYGQHDTSKFWIFALCTLCTLIGLLVAFLIWKTTNSLLTKETTSPEDSTGDLNADGVMKIILACMGVYFAINAIIAFPRIFVDFQIAKKIADQQSLVSAISLGSVILQIIFGCLLISKPAKWVKMIRSVKEK
ncbi:MAG: hypothetical protein V3V05_13340 [Pontiella sp.]